MRQNIAEARRRFPSLSWNEEQWAKALTTRPDTIERLAAKMASLPRNRKLSGHLEQPSEQAETLGITAGGEKVLRLVAQGLTNKQVARRLNLSDATVKRHLAEMYQRVGVDNRMALVLAARRADVPGID